MLEPDYIEHFTDETEAAVRSLSSDLVALYAAQMPNTDEVATLTMADIAIAAQTAAKKAVKLLARHSRLIDRAAVKAVDYALHRSATTDIEAIGKTLSWFPDSVSDNLNATTAASISAIRTVLQRDNLAMAEAVRSAYMRSAMEAVAEVNGIGKRWEQACRDAVVKLADDGVRIVDYKSKAIAQADVAVRRHIRTQVVQAGAKNTLHLLEAAGHDLVQTSSHGGARDDHAVWQGRIFSLSGKSAKYPNFYTATGYGGVAGLCGANCRHSFAVYIEGQPKRYQSDPDKEQGRNREEVYKATQKQRYHEREIRKCKREAVALESAGMDSVDERLKIGAHQKALREHLKEHPYLSRESKREQVYEHKGKTVYPLSPTAQYRKKGTHRKIGADGKQVASKPVVDKVRKRLERKGGQLLVADDAMLKHLEEVGASAVTYGDTAIVLPDATTSDVLEEARHAEQNIDGMNDHLPNDLRTILNEIDAKEHLLANAERYNIPGEETSLTRSQLDQYRKALDEWKRRNGWPG